MNHVIIAFNDPKNRQAAIILNGKQVGVGYDSKLAKNGFDMVTWFIVNLSNIHNQSASVVFEARTLKGLVGKINRYKFELVK